MSTKPYWKVTVTMLFTKRGDELDTLESGSLEKEAEVVAGVLDQIENGFKEIPGLWSFYFEPTRDHLGSTKYLAEVK